MSKDRRPDASWLMRWPASVYPNGYVRTAIDDLIQIVYFERDGQAQVLMLNRRDARLLARRINQCLDGTVKR
ncbi:MAG TPA: hypothetical protein VF062_19500 [Candidatus Limnocylindrales bacterium]